MGSTKGNVYYHQTLWYNVSKDNDHHYIHGPTGALSEEPVWTNGLPQYKLGGARKHVASPEASLLTEVDSGYRWHNVTITVKIDSFDLFEEPVGNKGMHQHK